VGSCGSKRTAIAINMKLHEEASMYTKILVVSLIKNAYSVVGELSTR